MRLFQTPEYEPARLAKMQQADLVRGSALQRALARIGLGGKPLLAELICRFAGAVSRADYRFTGLSAVFVWARGDDQTAESLCARALMLDPGNSRLRWLLGTIIWEQHDPERALAVLGEFAGADAESRPLLALRIRLHMSRGEYESVIELARAASGRFPDSPWAFSALMRALISIQDVEQARLVSAEAMGRFPSHAVFYRSSVTLARRAGNLEEALRIELLGLQENPGDSVLMRLLLQSLGMYPESEPAARVCLDSYLAIARQQALDFGVLRQVADYTGTEPDQCSIRLIANAEEPADNPLDKLLAQAALGDFKSAAQTIGRLLQDGSTDQRLLAFLSVYGSRLETYLGQDGLPGLDFLQHKCRAWANSVDYRQDEPPLLPAVISDLACDPEQESGAPLVSYLCPIHRSRDIDNLITQINRQAWGNAQVIICISSPLISEEIFIRGIRHPFRRDVFRCEPGMRVGYYLNQCIKRAGGEFLLRLDADDAYAPEYTRYMVSWAQHSRADVLCMDLTSYYFENIDQTYHIRAPSVAAGAPASSNAMDRVGSGSSLCARASVFDSFLFEEDLPRGEDLKFYLQARRVGLQVRVVPGYFHTTMRHSDSASHTWQMDDFNLLTASARYQGEGCRLPDPASPLCVPPAEDPFDNLFADESLDWLRELPVGELVRRCPWPLRLVVGEGVAVPVYSNAMLEVTTSMSHSGADGRQTWIFFPDNPAKEYALSRRNQWTSVLHDVVPHLVAQKRDDFYRSRAFYPFDTRRTGRRYRRSKHRYLILCNPRSGSEHLSSLLSSVGLGSPSELVRRPVAHLLGNGAELDTYLPIILDWCVRAEVAGTKIVTQYLFQDFAADCLRDLFLWLENEQFRIVRLSRPEAESAVSAWAAAETGRWHSLERPAIAAGIQAGVVSSALTYDFDRIATHMKDHLAWTQRLDWLLARHFPEHRILSVDYESLTGNPGSVVRGIADFIGVNLLPGVTPVSKARPRSRDLPEMAQYRARFDAEWSDALAGRQ